MLFGKSTPLIKVWAGILGYKIIGPILMQENFTGQLYVYILENLINSLITESLENEIDQDINLLLDVENLYFFKRTDHHIMNCLEKLAK